jgi:hypothetical protein
MQSDDARPSSEPAPKRPWHTPIVQTLPKLIELTLQSGGIIPGGGGGGGSTIF